MVLPTPGGSCRAEWLRPVRQIPRGWRCRPMRRCARFVQSAWRVGETSGSAVVAPQEQSPPDHRANAPQNHLELVNAQQLGARHWSLIVSPRIALPKGFPNSLGGLAPSFFMLHSTHSPPRVSVLITRGYSMILRCDGVFSSRFIVAFKCADNSLLNN